MIDQEEEAFKALLAKKFALFRNLISSTLEHDHEPARITLEQARRVALYAHETYFRHLRLYDFVLKNTKLSEVKRVHIPIIEPNCGDDLCKAMVLADDSIKAPTLQDIVGGASGQLSLAQVASGGMASASDPLGSQDMTGKDG